MSNPLLSTEELPLFNQILPSHIEPAMDHLLQINRSKINEILNATKDYTWDNLVLPLDELENNLSRAWSTVGHLNAVMDSPDLRNAHEAVLPKLTDYYTELGQNEDLYHAFLSI